MDLPRCKICGERHRLGGCPSSKSSDGGVESRHAGSLVGRAATDRMTGNTSRADALNEGTPSGGLPSLEAGVAPSPSEAKRKRAPRGTFDRNAYQRDYMRKRRAKP